MYAAPPFSSRGVPVLALSLQAAGTGAVALLLARGFYVRVKGAPEGNAQMARIARYIREGAMAFLVRANTRSLPSTRCMSSCCFPGAWD